MPFLNFLTIFSFREHNPDWKIIFIRPSDKANVKGEWVSPEHESAIRDQSGIDYSEHVGEYADEVWQFDFKEILGDNLEVNDVHKADVIRPYLMHKYGGVWSDCDIFFLKPMSALNLSEHVWRIQGKELPESMTVKIGRCLVDIPVELENIDAAVSHYEIYNEKGDFNQFTGMGDGSPNPHYKGIWRTGMFWSSPDNPMFKKILEKSVECLDTGQYQSAGPHAIAALWARLQELKNDFPDLNVANFPEQSIYPYTFNGMTLFWKTNKFNLRARQSIKENTIGIHWFNGNIFSKKYAGIDSRTWGKNTTYTETIKKYKGLYEKYEK
jgi:hypothetical protein